MIADKGKFNKNVMIVKGSSLNPNKRYQAGSHFKIPNIGQNTQTMTAKQLLSVLSTGEPQCGTTIAHIISNKLKKSIAVYALLSSKKLKPLV